MSAVQWNLLEAEDPSLEEEGMFDMSFREMKMQPGLWERREGAPVKEADPWLKQSGISQRSHWARTKEFNCAGKTAIKGHFSQAWRRLLIR